MNFTKATHIYVDEWANLPIVHKICETHQHETFWVLNLDQVPHSFPLSAYVLLDVLETFYTHTVDTVLFVTSLHRYKLAALCALILKHLEKVDTHRIEKQIPFEFTEFDDFFRALRDPRPETPEVDPRVFLHKKTIQKDFHLTPAPLVVQKTITCDLPSSNPASVCAYALLFSFYHSPLLWRQKDLESLILNGKPPEQVNDVDLYLEKYYGHAKLRFTSPIIAGEVEEIGKLGPGRYVISTLKKHFFVFHQFGNWVLLHAEQHYFPARDTSLCTQRHGAAIYHFDKNVLVKFLETQGVYFSVDQVRPTRWSRVQHHVPRVIQVPHMVADQTPAVIEFDEVCGKWFCRGQNTTEHPLRLEWRMYFTMVANYTLKAGSMIVLPTAPTDDYPAIWLTDVAHHVLVGQNGHNILPWIRKSCAPNACQKGNLLYLLQDVHSNTEIMV